MSKKLSVKSIRAKLGLNQTQMAERLGVDQGTISRMENGQKPSGPILKLLEMLNA